MAEYSKNGVRLFLGMCSKRERKVNWKQGKSLIGYWEKRNFT